MKTIKFEIIFDVLQSARVEWGAAADGMEEWGSGELRGDVWMVMFWELDLCRSFLGITCHMMVSGSSADSFELSASQDGMSLQLLTGVWSGSRVLFPFILRRNRF